MPDTENQTEVQIEPTPREKAEARAKELTAELKEEVSCIVFTDENNKSYYGYYKKPSRLAAIPAVDLAMAGKYTEAGSRLFAICFLTSYSDAEIEKVDEYYLTTCTQIGMNIKIALPDIKKN